MLCESFQFPRGRAGGIGPHTLAVLQFRAEKLSNLDRGGKSDPFLQISRPPKVSAANLGASWKMAKNAMIGKSFGAALHHSPCTKHGLATNTMDLIASECG